MRALPTFILIRGNAGRPVPWVTGLIAMLAAAISSDAPGGEAVVNRLAEALLAQVLRSALAEQGSRLEVRAWPPHPQIAAAIELIHRDPAHSWTVGVLAEEVGFSRSVFAARFRALVGESPKRYITRCRLAHAATLLDTTTLTLAEIARSAGYETEFSLSKAFRREFGLAPGAYRAQSEPARPRLAVST